MAYVIAFINIILMLTATGHAAFEEEDQENPSEGALEKLFAESPLTGDWMGYRERLLKRGIWMEAVYTGDTFSNVSGGIRQDTNYLANLDLLLSFDLEKLVGWRNTSAFIYGLGNYGGDPSDAVGDVQILDNIQAPDTFKLYEAWIQRHFMDHKVSWLAGLYDLNAEFYLMDTAALFIHSSPGIGVGFSQSGRNGPSIFPVTSVGTRIKFRPIEQAYAQLAVLDGVPGDPDDPKGTHIIFDQDDGLLLAGEVAYLVKPEQVIRRRARPLRPGRRLPQEARQRRYTGKYAVGVWLYTAEFQTLGNQTLMAGPAKEAGNLGFYAFAEHKLFQEPQHLDQGLSGYLQVGRADPRFNQFEFYTGGGLVYTGLFPGRDEDRLGIAVATGHNGRTFKRSRRELGLPVADAETAVELTYRAQLEPWLAIQPDFQYIVNPGTDPTIENALALGLRFQLIF